MRAFDFYAAKDSSEAVALLAQHGPAVKVLAGGTDLLADLKFASASHAPKVVVDISRADDLRGIETTEQGLRIGALGHPHGNHAVAGYPRSVPRPG
jgi:carbon-monoxide dehydrogenase medium subunit